MDRVRAEIIAFSGREDLDELLYHNLLSKTFILGMLILFSVHASLGLVIPNCI